MARWTSLALVLATWSAVVYGQTPGPLSIAFNASMPVGPDGPWLSITQVVDVNPNEYLSFLPSLSNTSLFINASTCNAAGANCPLPRPALWTLSTADINNNDEWTVGPSLPASAWDTNQASLLGLTTGQGSSISQSITLHPDGNFAAADFVWDVAMTVSNGFAATYPGGASYTLDVGFFSLYGDADLFVWTNSTGNEWHNLRNLAAAYVDKFIPSISYGLTVGSVYPSVDGSLVLGGYDAALILSEPLVSNTNMLSLRSITLNVSSGASAYTQTTDNTSIPMGNFLRANGSVASSLQVNPDPGVPYLYLPQETCDAIAGHLPVTFNSDFNLYTWNPGSDFDDIVTSPHYMSFTFASNGGSSTTTINVPFALLNLTLTSPLVSQNTQYFPCSPWKAKDGAPFTLGRAFLQAAFLGANWQTNTFFISQAPGPDVRLLPVVTTINAGDTTIRAASNPPSWESTWSSTLVDLKPSANGTANSTTSHASKTGLSGGAIAGIVIGVIAVIAVLAGLAAFFLSRKRKQQRLTARNGEQEELRPYGSPQNPHAPPQYHDDKLGPHYEKRQQPLGLVEAPNNAQILAEAPGHYHADPAELDGHMPAPQELGTGK